MIPKTRPAAAFLALSVALGSAASALSAAAANTDTILDKLNDLDRYANSEDDRGLDRFRWNQRNWYDYDILTAAVIFDGTLVGAVTDPGSELTVFIPNDRAFQLLAYDLTGDWLYKESQVLDVIVAAVQAGDVDLTNVLTYHVVAGRVEKADVPFDTPVTTLNGDTITFRSRFFGWFVELQDNVAAFRNPYLLSTDLDAGNSVLHSISRVLVPVDVGG